MPLSSPPSLGAEAPHDGTMRLMEQFVCCVEKMRVRLVVVSLLVSRSHRR